jgi:probable LLM family oxidoreductase
MELGIFTFGDMPLDGSVSEQQRLKDLLEEVELADQVGLDVYGIGEHHRPDFVISSPTTLLAAAAMRTKNIRLCSAVTVLSSEDPVRVFQQFATIDLISDGRAEIVAGRGSFIESFPLFGYELSDYEELYEEKLDLLLNLRDNVIINWHNGRHRASINGLGVYPRPLQEKLPIWIAIGGTPKSVVRAGSLGLPLAIAILGGDPLRFSPLVDLHRKVTLEHGHQIQPLGINIHGFIADTSQRARDLFWPGHERAMNHIGSERGWAPQDRQHFEAECGPTGAIAVGSSQEVIDKILRTHEHMQMDRFMMQLSIGYLPHKDIMRAIELYGTVVAPAVRQHIGAKQLV